MSLYPSRRSLAQNVQDIFGDRLHYLRLESWALFVQYPKDMIMRWSATSYDLCISQAHIYFTEKWNILTTDIFSLDWIVFFLIAFSSSSTYLRNTRITDRSCLNYILFRTVYVAYLAGPPSCPFSRSAMPSTIYSFLFHSALLLEAITIVIISSEPNLWSLVSSHKFGI